MANLKCVLQDCDKNAVGQCNNCRIPICSVHGKKINNRFYLCINCFNYTKQLGLRK